MFFKRIAPLTLLICCVSPYAVTSAYANEPSERAVVLEQTVLKSFVQKMRNNYSRANSFMRDAGIEEDRFDLRGLPDGELLILDVKLPDGIQIDGTVLGEVYNRQIYVSLRDLISILEFPIEYDAQTQNFSGWYIRENRRFNLDKASGIVTSNATEYKIGSDILVKEDDLYFPLSSYESWFNLKLIPDVGTQVVNLDANPPLPIMERFRRRQFEERRNNRKPASLPRGDDSYDLLGVPQADVSLRSSYRNPENSDPTRRQDVNIRTSGEFAYGTLSTNIAADSLEQVTNVRATYLRESAYPELLGPLKARRFELGDVQPTRVPITGGAPPETGMRITNTDPLVSQTLPSTKISGYIFPGWDVELYRENSLLAFSETDENGYYSFDNVQLFSNRNFFRVVAYGPQGEVREENVNVPYDPNREATDGGIYDVSLSLQNRQFYQKFDSVDEDRNTPHFVGFFEKPITDNAALRLGARYREENGENKAYASAGVTSAIAGALVNATVASDEQGELASEMVLSRQFGPHNFRTGLDLATDNYNPGSNGGAVQVFSNRYNLEGPLPFSLGDRPRYSAAFNYAENSNGDSNYNGRVNLNTRYKRLGINQALRYSDGGNFDDGAEIASDTAVTGIVGKNTYRGRMQYNFAPEAELDSLFASWRRRIKPELETQLELGHTLEDDLTRLSGQLNWRPEFATISPRVSYDSRGNVEATLNTRFGVSRVPDTGEFIFSRDFVANSGSISAFVFLDKNGNQLFDGEDEPIPNARVQTPQNARGGDTNDEGVAFIAKLRPNIITDVFVEQGSLEDPFWIPGAEGVSIMPRTGVNVRVDIPVHISGEIDGVVYAKKPNGTSIPLRNLTLQLQNEDGIVEQSVYSGPDGFYLFSLVPPGRYTLTVADQGLPNDVRRPRPQFIEIGYDGTTIFGNDIILDAGQRDIPSEIIANLDDYRAQHPHIDFSQNNYEIALNLGAYKSRLLTSFMWYRLKTRYGAILRDTQLYVPPSQSYALPKTGEHTLRVGLKSENIDDAYNRCRALVARDLYCKVEIYPTAKKQKFAAAPSNDG